MGPQFDLLNTRNSNKLFCLISSRHVIMVWWGTPCTSLSTARKLDGGPPPLRDSTDITLPSRWCNEAQVVKVLQANQLVELTAKGIALGHSVGAKFVLENPEFSKLWSWPSIVEILSITCAVRIMTHFCCWLDLSETPTNRPWLKPTALVGTLPGLQRLARQCSPVPWCRIHSVRHQTLQGKHGDSWWTKLAEPYPHALCSAVVALYRDLLAGPDARPAHAEPR